LVVLSCSFLQFACKNSVKTDDLVSPPAPINSTANAKSRIDLSYFKKEGDAYILPWKDLLAVQMRDSFHQKVQDTVLLPMFNDTLRALDGQVVIAEGYFIPVSETGDDNIVIISAYPYSNCFFCGKAGVESIIDVISPKKAPKVKMDNKIRFKGRFKLNVDNFDYLIYMLEDAEYLGLVN
jgi:hypothetical protein